VVFFKLLLGRRLENVGSARRLVAPCNLRRASRYFLGYEVDEDLPGHSTISRTRQLYPAAVFDYLFEHVFGQGVAAGLVTGHTQAVDSAPVKANASLERLGEQQSVDAPLPILRVRDGLASTASAAQSAVPVTSPEHHLRRGASTHARYLRQESGPLGRRPKRAC